MKGIIQEKTYRCIIFISNGKRVRHNSKANDPNNSSKKVTSHCWMFLLFVEIIGWITLDYIFVSIVRGFHPSLKGRKSKHRISCSIIKALNSVRLHIYFSHVKAMDCGTTPYVRIFEIAHYIISFFRFFLVRFLKRIILQLQI